MHPITPVALMLLAAATPITPITPIAVAPPAPATPTATATATATAPAPALATPAAIVTAAPPSAWRDIAPDQMLVMELADGGRVVIALAPSFAPVHVANIRALALAHWWDGTSINRVQDDYVTQWGDATEHKPLPPGIVAHPPAEYDRAAVGLAIRRLAYRDSYAEAVGHVYGWPVAATGGRAWLPHCYGMVGVGRDLAPDTGIGAELYAVIGQAPRHLDRNIAVVGRVLAGMEQLSARPRGTGALGFYEDAGQRIAIARVRLASDLPAAARPRFQVMASASASFAAWVQARAHRHDTFFVRPAGAVDICNVMPPVRIAPR